MVTELEASKSLMRCMVAFRPHPQEAETYVRSVVEVCGRFNQEDFDRVCLEVNREWMHGKKMPPPAMFYAKLIAIEEKRRPHIYDTARKGSAMDEDARARVSDMLHKLVGEWDARPHRKSRTSK